MTMLPFITVVIPTHNRAGFLKRALTSVFNQNYRSVEVIVVDDNSDEELSSALSSVPAADITLRVLRNEQSQGGQCSRLIGARAAQGTLIALLDSDDWWESTKLEEQYAVWEQFPRALVSCRVRLATSGRVIPQSIIGKYEKVEEFIYVRGGFLQSSTFLAARDIMIDGLSHSLYRCHNDTSLAMYLAAKGVEIIQLEAPLSYFDDYPRPDRISMSSDKMMRPLQWFYDLSGDWSPEARAGFLVRDTARRYLNIGNRKEAITTLFKAYHPNLPKTLYMRTFISILFGGSPVRFYRDCRRRFW